MEELDRITAAIAKYCAELHRLTLAWVDEQIDREEHDRRAAGPKAALERLHAARVELHSTAPETEAELDALIADVRVCRQEAIERRGRLRDPQQSVADEIDGYTLRLEELTKRGTFEDPLVVWADCRYCRHRIRRPAEDDGPWVHCDVDGRPLPSNGARGCRAASFDRDGDWNDALPRTKTAAPARGTVTQVVPRG
ncbi:hypothetical protein [Kribbella sp. NPDC051770]|uniref:hypothetical protein n=1 Tax=Kribbella sp. NPDC051770 TaxID=3155413 RepID=UPI00341A92B4